ncbi:MAG: TolC family protein, partial [Chthoniobacterales bacterium]|nr:TolC family protein [Chthoniobacterales bacterium]
VATPAYTILEQSLAGAPMSPGSSAPQNRVWSFQLSLNQLLFDSGAAFSATKAAKLQETAAYFLLRKTIDETIAAVKTNFYQIILNRALISAQEQSVALLESQLQDQINRFEAGVVPRFNVLQAEVALANAIPPLIQAYNNLRISQYQFIRLLGMDYGSSDPTQIPIDVKGDLDVPYREINLEESIRTALIRNPQLKAQRFDILAQAAQVNVALAGYGPRISAQAGYEWQNDRTSRDLGDILNGWFLGIQASWNLFDSFLTAGQVKQAKARLRQSKALYDNAVRDVILQVQEAVSNLTEAFQTIESQKANLSQATEALRLARERLDAGAGTQLDVLNAQTSLLQAQTTLLQAKFSYISALARYDAALSLDTQWVNDFKDPLESPEKRRLIRTNLEDYRTPDLPREFRSSDPLKQLLPKNKTSNRS